MLMVCFLVCCCVVCSCSSNAAKTPKTNSQKQEPTLLQKTAGHQAPQLPATKQDKFSAKLQPGDIFNFEGNFNDANSFKLTINLSTIDGTKESIEVVMSIVPWETKSMQDSAHEIGTFPDETILFLTLTEYNGQKNPCYFTFFSGSDRNCVGANVNTSDAVIYDKNDNFINASYELTHNAPTKNFDDPENPAANIVHRYWLKKVT